VHRSHLGTTINAMQEQTIQPNRSTCTGITNLKFHYAPQEAQGGGKFLKI